MRVACISHGSIVPFNRRPYDLLRSEHGVDITVIVPETWAGDLPAPEIRFDRGTAGDHVRALPVRRSGNGSLFTLAGLGALLRELDPDLVLLDEEPWSLVAWQTLRAGVNAPLLFYSKQNIAKWLPPPFGWIRRLTYRRAVRAWAVGETTAEVLRKTRFGHPVDVIPHGVETSAFTPGRDEGRRREIGLEGVVIGYAGRLVEEKGVRDLVDAAQLLAAIPGPPFTLLFAGAGPLAAELGSASSDRLRVKVLPAVPHQYAPAIYRLMDIFVLPSRATRRWREQFGRALVEAGATALPIVAAGTGEIPHVMQGLGGGGRVVPEAAPIAITEALRELRDDAAMRARIGAANLAAARRFYSQGAIASRMATMLDAALAASRQPSAVGKGR